MRNVQSPSSALKGLYAITDPVLLPGKKLIRGVESALRGGARLIQYRDKTATDLQRVRNAEDLRAITTQYGARLLINDDIALCLRVNADGVHLGQSDGDPGAVREQLGPNKLLGATCYRDIGFANIAIQQGVDYCAFGRFFPSRTKPDAPICPLEVLSEAVKLPCSILAIGGITPENSSALLSEGVDMIAVIHGLFAQDDIEATARSFSALFPHTL